MTKPFFTPPSGTTDPVATPSPSSPDSSSSSPDLAHQSKVHRTAITRRDNHTRNTTNGQYLRGDRKK